MNEATNATIINITPKIPYADRYFKDVYTEIPMKVIIIIANPGVNIIGSESVSNDACKIIENYLQN